MLLGVLRDLIIASVGSPVKLVSECRLGAPTFHSGTISHDYVVARTEELAH